MGNSVYRRRKRNRNCNYDRERYEDIPSHLSVEESSEEHVAMKTWEADQRKQPAISEQSEFSRVRALFSYDGLYPDDLSFKKGDQMLVSTKTLDTWVYARHCTTGEGGFIPGNYVRFDNNEPPNVEGFFAVDRLEAEKKLFMPGLPCGTYILRRKGDGVGFVLSVRVCNASQTAVNVKHYRIAETSDGRYYILNSRRHATIAALIKRYTEIPGPLKCRLDSPFPHVYLPPVKFRDFEAPRSSIRLGKRLGEGEFGEVYAGVWNGQMPVAVKQHRQNSNREAFITEARNMYTLYHERIVSLLGVCTEPPEEPIWIIMELMPRGSLLNYLKSEDGNHLEIKDQVLIMLQISQGMRYLEEKHFVHRDLRASNVLVDRDGSVKVADFGLARVLQENYEYAGTARFPVRWTAPEAATGQHIFSTHSDVWSFGVVMYEILTFGQRPYANMETREVIPQILDGYRLPNPLEGTRTGDSLYMLMRQCWDIDPRLRPSFKSIYHEFCTWDFSGS